MRFLIVIVLALCAMPVYGQGWPDGTMWLYKGVDFIPMPGDPHEAIVKLGDTTIADRPCQFLHEYSLREIAAWDPFTNNPHTIHIVSYDSNRIDYYEPETETFYPLYDFTAQMGDTLHVYTRDDYLPFKTVVVAFAGTIPITNDTVKAMWVNSVDGEYGFLLEGHVYEKIGWLNYFFPQPGFVDPPPAGEFVCFKSGDISAGSSWLCDVQVAANVAAPRSYPNILVNSHTIMVDKEVDQMMLFDMLGRQCGRAVNSAKIEMSQVTSGIYVLVIQVRGVRYVNKICIPQY